MYKRQYTPLWPRGARAGHVVAFARRVQEAWVVAAAPRLTTRLSRAPAPPVGQEVWQDTVLPLPADAPTLWRDAFTGATIRLEQDGPRALAAADVFARFPVALLVAE